MHSAYILGYKPQFKIKIEHRLNLKLLTKHIFLFQYHKICQIMNCIILQFGSKVGTNLLFLKDSLISYLILIFDLF